MKINYSRKIHYMRILHWISWSVSYKFNFQNSVEQQGKFYL